MEITIYTYLCTHGQCRNVEKRSGVNNSQIKCPQCDHQMNKISTEKVKK